jgi:hypothetical protein
MEERHWIMLYNLFMLYIMIGQVCAMYFWYLYTQDHGFLASLVIGPIVGEFKGLLFPFFI